MMFQGWRLKLREADEASAQGRLHDAERLLRDSRLLEYLPGRRLADRVARQLADRARHLLLRGETAEAWREMARARDLGGDAETLWAIRREMTEVALSDIESRLQADDLAGAREALAQLEPHGTQLDALRRLRDTLQAMEAARHDAQRGRFAQAIDKLRVVAARHSDWHNMRTCMEQWQSAAVRSRKLTAELHRAMSGENWHAVVELSDALLELAPRCSLALEARRRAWEKVGTPLVESHVAGETRSRREEPKRTRECRMTDRHDDTRFLMWVDGVGGYLVCMGSDVIIGQAVPESNVDIAVVGDISRRHLKIHRERDGYLAEPLANARLRGRQLEGTALLRDDDILELGNSVRMRFRQPHALSLTARLEFVSSHRLFPSADGVLLMAESCVLGPRSSNHVLCRSWQHDLIVYRRDDKLYCRTTDPIEVDGRMFRGVAEITRRSRITGSDFSLGFEPVT